MQRNDSPGATRAELLALLAPLGLAVAAYARALRGEFQFDDVGGILENPAMRSLARWADQAFTPGAILAGRPLTALTFVANHAAGGYDPLGYHVEIGRASCRARV